MVYYVNKCLNIRKRVIKMYLYCINDNNVLITEWEMCIHVSEIFSKIFLLTTRVWSFHVQELLKDYVF